MKHQTSKAKLLVFLGIASLVWAACQQPAQPDDFDYEKAKNHIMPLKDAIVYQRHFLKAYDTTLKKLVGDTFLRQQFRIPNAETFDKNAIKLLLHQPGVDSIRIFYGMDSAGGMRQILVGVDAKGTNIYTKLLRGKDVAVSLPGVSSAKAQSGGDTSFLENGQTCPPCIINRP